MSRRYSSFIHQTIGSGGVRQPHRPHARQTERMRLSTVSSAGAANCSPRAGDPSSDSALNPALGIVQCIGAQPLDC
jgi:hypothetical protein